MKKLIPIGLGAVLVAILAVVLLTRPHGHGPPAPPPAPAARTLTVENRPVGTPIPPGFLGLSLEYPTLLTYGGTDPTAIDPVFEQLVRNLSPGQRPVLRVGGVSTDHTWAPIPGVPQPLWARYALTPQLVAVARALATRLDARLILGLNLEADSPQIAAAEARTLQAGIGRRAIDAFELGNEPELWAGFPWYRTPDGVRVRGRSRDWSFPVYAQQFAGVAAALAGAPVAGPAVGSVNWSRELGPFLRANPRVSLATLHAYPLKRCRATTHVSAGQLLAESSSAGLAALVTPYARAAQAVHVPLRIAEINSISCGGEAGVSDSFASALWSLDALFALARAGIAGVNLHTTPHVSNQLFSFTQTAGHWTGRVYPIYYGLMTFARAAPAGSRLLAISGPTRGTVRAWATRAPDGRIRVVLINAGGRGTSQIALRMPAGLRRGTVERLTAPGLLAGDGVTLAGQGFGEATATGAPSGPVRADPVTVAGGAFRIRLPAASAALVSF